MTLKTPGQVPQRVILSLACFLLVLDGLTSLDLSGPLSKRGHKASCSQLPTLDASWDLTLCPTTLQLRRKSGCPSGSPPPLAHGTHPKLLALAQTLGPDELFVLCEGPEFHVLEGTHQGSCSYTFPLPPRLLGGEYRVAVVLQRVGWQALAEEEEGEEGGDHTHAFPPLVGLHLASTLVTLGPRASPDAWEGARLAALGHHPQGGVAHLSSLPPPPPCTTAAHRFGRGRWVRSREAVGMFGEHSWYADTGGSSTSSGSAESTLPTTPPPLQGWYSHADRFHVSSGLLYFTDMEQDLVWVPYHCTPAPPSSPLSQGAPPQPLLARVAAACLKGHSSLRFQGDSQLRTLYNDVLLRHCGITNAAAKGLVDDVCVGRATGERERAQGLVSEDGTCPGLHSCFLADPWGIHPPNASTLTLLPPPSTPSIVGAAGAAGGGMHPSTTTFVFNLGQHSAARHETFAAYEQRIRGYLAKAVAAAAEAVEVEAKRGSGGGGGGGGEGGVHLTPPSPPRLLFVESQPFPVRYDDPGVTEYADGRTQPRLRMYNAIAREAALELGVEVLDLWDITEPLVDASPDGAHFNGLYPVLDALGGRLLGKLC